ncbi:sodium-dependent phosphate transporter 1-A [Pseudovirgaria hyperparasitica]|uniref:Phosphate transporter n=1 Tax=Pseudovirgaria hyperparasitica TaxID=470096 RepID=A0A6A6VVX0_9PEZI|nr:sodium-dependent phosphate transporter 1-A [Pseudovirgaria hyperparasitica]KAF2754383.1 sodium-dependent phosphate transporter 1-A [Pseudovirgaria hyperparasitica]
MAVALPQYNWIIAIISIAFCFSSFFNGANDVANSYATSIAARSLTMPEVGILSIITEFVGAVALGGRVIGTIRNNIIDISRYEERPATLLLGMGCAEAASATWLYLATMWGWPVSTTQTIVGALVGMGIASNTRIAWGWSKGSVSQIAASWGAGPVVAGAISAALYSTLKFGILERERSFERAMAVIPWYLAFTAAVLALFITIEAPGVGSPEELGAGRACGIVFGVFLGVLVIGYVFFKPYFHRRLVLQDARCRVYHLPLGPLLYRKDPPLYFPGNPDGEVVINYYAHNRTSETANSNRASRAESSTVNGLNSVNSYNAANPRQANKAGEAGISTRKPPLEPEVRFLASTADLPLYRPARLWAYTKYHLLQGVTRDCVSHADSHVQAVHARAKRYDNRVEHLWTYAQVASAMMMSIAHGSNDVANAVAPWATAYGIYQTGLVSEGSKTPTWILVAAGALLGIGFWFQGYHIIRAMGNKITQMSPTRGYAMELGTAITVLIASRMGLPVSTTQCLTGATIGVALMNLDVKALNWRQIGFIGVGWVLTLPSAGLLAGLAMGMALNAPHF